MDYNDFFDFTGKLDQEAHPISAFPSDKLTHPDYTNLCIYSKKAVKIVTDPDTLYAFKYMAANVYSYSRNPFRGLEINGVQYTFYVGKLNTQCNIGLVMTVVLSSKKKVYKIVDIENPVEMNWEENPAKKGK